MSSTEPSRSVVFVCTHNSARSQMAEGYLRHVAGDRYDVYSAGTERTHVRPFAIAVMNEIGIDLSGHHSKTLDDLVDVDKDIVVTVCDHAKETCPVVHAEQVMHKSFPDPSAATGSDEERLNAFRSVRDDLISWIDQTFVSAPDA
ncbi:low molecular weight phosphatase family protein [Longibacter salinarum]|uniref:Low molecular weight phosphatase family protein n=1 Tax=Longibacter salinarum TaxID=1850348 RepID=A0A2A8CX47_9BACT|nr:arsenate reductase ArsC [Longibacter salinarum]PEN13275.1 low molecular weight phosphatase family protein [Longibacter salinarum]